MTTGTRTFTVTPDPATVIEYLKDFGHAEQWDEIVYHGNVAKQDFLALYVQGSRILAAAGMNRDTDMIYIAELLGLGKLPASADVHDKTDWAALL
jgi:hypothetical protein